MTNKNAPDLRYETLIRKEWLLPNGRGGYASGTFSGLNTRKYHGLLISGFEEGGGRSLYVNSLEEKLVIGDHRFFFSAHKYCADAVYPRGYVHLVDYGQAPGLVWLRYANFQDHDFTVLKVVRVKKGHEAVEIEYFFQGDTAGVNLMVYPLVTARNIHQVKAQAPYHSERGDEWTGKLPFIFDRVEPGAGGWHGLSMQNKMNTRLCKLLSSESEYTDKQDWYHDFQYTQELERGYESIEDLYCPGKFAIGGDQMKDPLRLVFSLVDAETPADECVPHFEGHDLTCSQAFKAFPGKASEPKDIISRWHQKLTHQAEDFWVENKVSHTGIIAGYPWFGIWSRDMLQSLSGLLLQQGHTARAKKMLITIAGQSRDGLVPNIMEESAKRYEFLGDSPLWFIVALYQYMEATGERATLDFVWPTLQHIIVRYLHPDGEHPVMDQDGMIVLVGDGTRAATWMDAIVMDRAVTPRYGRPVEIQALWYNALCILQELSKKYDLGYPLAEEAIHQRGFAGIDTIRTAVKKTFLTKFVHPTLGYLADVVGDTWTSWQVRPNQLFAAGLPFPLLTRPQTQKMLALVDAELVTPWGIRTLSNKDPEYRGAYAGWQTDRDRAYHQGTVWPWLSGMYARSVTYALGAADGAKAVRAQLISLLTHVESLGLLYIPEVFGADDGHPDGTFHQAWSVAEILGMIALVDTTSAKTKKQPKRRKSA